MPTKPGPPESVSITNLTARSLTISWGPPAVDGGATVGYIINQYKGTDTSVFMHSYDVSGTTINITGLIPGSFYTFYLWSYNGILSDQVGPETIQTDAGCWIRHNGVWVSATPYIRVSGIWKQAQPYVRVAGNWQSTY